MKKCVILCAALLAAACFMNGCTYRALVVIPVEKERQYTAPAPKMQIENHAGQLFRYANPRTHRDSLLFKIEKAGRAAAIKANERRGT